MKNTLIAAILGIILLVGSLIPVLKDAVVSFFVLENIAFTDDLVIPPDSFLLGPREKIAGISPNLSLNELVVLKDPALLTWIERSDTQVLLIKKGGQIIHESYAEHADKGLKLNALSMSKTITAMIVGIAIEEGHIASVDDRVAVYLPELNSEDSRDITLRQLLQQVSGMHDATTDVLKTLQGESLENNLSKIEFSEDKEFTYSNINYHLLNLVLQRVYEKPLNEILKKKLWEPLALEEADVINATGYCCIFATAHTWMRIGELFLSEGLYKGQQVVPKEWLKQMIKDKTDPEFFLVQASSSSLGNSYGYHMFTDEKRFPGYYWSEGMGLQLLMIHPETETIIVRLGGIPSALGWDSNRWDNNLVADLLMVTEAL